MPGRSFDDPPDVKRRVPTTDMLRIPYNSAFPDTTRSYPSRVDNELHSGNDGKRGVDYSRCSTESNTRSAILQVPDLVGMAGGFRDTTLAHNAG